MLIFVYGDDTFRAQEKVKELRAAFQKKFDPTGMNLSVFPPPTGKLEPGEVLQAIGSMPFLSEKRMIVIRDLVGQNKKGIDEVWNDGLKKIPSSTIVVLWETLAPKELEKKPLFVELKNAAEVHHYPFPVLEGAALESWVAQTVKARGGTVALDALRALVEAVGSDLWQMNGEIEKLVAFANGKPVTVEMVKKLVRASFDDQIFALVDAVAQRRTQEALRLLEEERLSGAADGYIFSMLSRQVRILLGARCVLDENPRATKDIIASELGIHPFVASKAISQARSFTRQSLETAHDLLYRLDLGTKQGRYQDDLAVDLAVSALVGQLPTT